MSDPKPRPVASCDREGICESPHLVGALASVGIEHGKSVPQMAVSVLCDDCPLMPTTQEARGG